MRFQKVIAALALLLATVVAAPGSASAAQGGPPPAEFEDTYWLYCEYNCDHTVYYHRIHMRADGSMGYQRAAGDQMVYDGTDQWKLVGKYLVLIWTDGFAVEVYEVGTGGQMVYEGLHSGVDEPSVIQRAPESGGPGGSGGGSGGSSTGGGWGSGGGSTGGTGGGSSTGGGWGTGGGSGGNNNDSN